MKKTVPQIALVLGKGRWTIIKAHVAQVVAAVNAATPGSYTKVEIPDRGNPNG